MQTRRGLVPAVIGLLMAGALLVSACSDDDSNGGDNGANGEAVATVGDLSIYDPEIGFSLGNTAAGYVTIRNDGAEDRLIGADANVGGVVEVHETVTEGGSGVMRQVEGGVVVPADGEVLLERGGYHVMMMDIEPELEDGQEVEVTLEFENAGEVSFTVVAQQITGTAADEHDHDEHEEDHEHE